MRTSLNEIREAESFLAGKMAIEESLVFEARVITNPLLRSDVRFHKKLLEVVRYFHRRKVRRELQSIHRKLMTSPENVAFQQSVGNIFNP